MSRGPNCERRPGDAVGAAVMMMPIATDEINDSKRSCKTGSDYADAKAGLTYAMTEQLAKISRKAAAA